MNTTQLSLIVSVITLFNISPARGQWTEWPVSAGGNGHVYLAVISETLISWQEAEQFARSAGGYLATITSAAENAFVLGLANSPEYFLSGKGPAFGGYQKTGSSEPAEGWAWVTGEPWDYSNWATSQPDNNGGGEQEDSIHMLSDGKWNDKGSVGLYHYSYIIEKEVCTPHKARATAQLVNGFVVGATMLAEGCGYTNVPIVLIQGGGGTGATATAIITDGRVTGIHIVSAGCCYTNAPRILIASPPFVPSLNIEVSRVRVIQNVVLGRKYVLEASTNNQSWSIAAPAFTADDESVTNEFDTDLTGRFFRIRETP